MSDLAPWQAQVTPAEAVAPPHINADGAAAAAFASTAPPFVLPDQWTLAWAGNALRYQQAHPAVAGQGSGNANANWVWRVHRGFGSATDYASPGQVGLNLSDGAVSAVLWVGPHDVPVGDRVDALSVDLVAKTTRRWSALAVPIPRPDHVDWESRGDPQAFPVMLDPIRRADPIAIANGAPSSAAWPHTFHGLLYWVEMRAGLTAGEGRVLWRWDASEYDRAATTDLDFTDPRGRTWRNLQVQYPHLNVPGMDVGLAAPRRATVSRVTERIFTGTGAPDELPGQTPGDRYLDTDTGDVWTLVADYCLHTASGTGDARTGTLPGLVTGDWDVRVACLPVPIPTEAENRWLPSGGQRFLMAQKLNTNDGGWGIVNGGSGQRMMLRNGNVWLSTVGFAPAATSTGLGGRVQLDVDGFALTQPHERNAAGEWLLDRQIPVEGAAQPPPTFAAPVRVPAGDMNNVLSSAGDYYGAELRDGAGTVLLSVDFTRLRPGDTSLTDDGLTWTLTGDATVKVANIRWERVP